MLIFGYHPVREALRHRPHQVDRVLMSARRGTQRRLEIERLCRRHGLPCQAVSERELSERAAGVHNGFAAELRQAVGDAPAAADRDLVVLLEDIQDPRNLGALLRVFEGAGVARVLLRDRGSAPVSPTVVRTSAGAAEWLELERMTNTAHEIGGLKEEGFWVYGADPAGVPPWQVDLTGKLVLCFGGEQKGLRQRTRQLCDELVGLPMRGRVESLNVSAAAAAVIYEAVRQRMAGT